MKLTTLQSWVILTYCLWNSAWAAGAEECGIPKKILDYGWNVNGSLEDEGPLYFPLGQKNDTNLVKVVLYGSSLNPDEDLPKLCPRLTFNETDQMITGVNGTSAHFKCEPTDGKKWVRSCKFQKDDKSEYNFKMYVTLSDKKSYAFFIRCWENGLRGWSVMSTKKFLHDDVQFQILEHARSQGFETADAFPLRYKSCSGKTFP